MINRLLITILAVVSIAATSQSQERTANPGEDPNEAMVSDGAGVPNYGCPDPGRSCFKNLKHGRISDNTKVLPASASKNKDTGSAGSDSGSR